MDSADETAGGFGEFALIERLRSRLRSSESPDVVVGIGDDAAIVDAGSGKCWVISCDVQVQGTHFPKEGMSGFNVGHKALAVNVSDVAAMGGAPRFALISLGVPIDTPVSFLDEIYEGMNSKAEKWEVAVLGGNVTRTEGPFFIDVFVVGMMERKDILTRSGAKVGDQVLVTGHLGDAAAGLHVISHPELKSKLSDETHTALTFSQLRPQPRVQEGRAIASLHQATAMMDISDALSGDLAHICSASGVGAVIWEHELPISSSVLDLASMIDMDPKDWALHGGEDYELLLTAPASYVPELQKSVRKATGTSLTPIGEILPKSDGLLLQKTGEMAPLEVRSWDHLKKN